MSKTDEPDKTITPYTSKTWIHNPVTINAFSPTILSTCGEPTRSIDAGVLNPDLTYTQATDSITILHESTAYTGQTIPMVMEFFFTISDPLCAADKFTLLTDTSNLIIEDPCVNPASFVIGAITHIDTDYSIPAVFNFPTIVVQPTVCTTTFTCTYISGPNAGSENLCTYMDLTDYTGTGNPLDNPILATDDTGIITATDFKNTNGKYTFFSRDKVKFPPGVYNLRITATIGSQSRDADFTLTLHEPCDDATLSIGDDYFANN